jgi:hypothetical protein
VRPTETLGKDPFVSNFTLQTSHFREAAVAARINFKKKELRVILALSFKKSLKGEW